MSLTLNLPSEIESQLNAAAQLRGLAPSEYALQVIQRDLADEQRRQQGYDLLQSWIDQGDAAQQRETYEYLTRVLDEDRPADRKLFPPELMGVTW